MGPIKVETWPRFARNARRIRILDLRSDLPAVVCSEVIYPTLMAAALHGTHQLFPLLHTLKFLFGSGYYEKSEGAQFTLLLMQSNLQHLHITITDLQDWDFFGVYLRDAASLVHRLVTLKFDFDFESEDGFTPINPVEATSVEAGFVALIRGNPMLTSIHLPSLIATRNYIWSAIAELDHLEELTFKVNSSDSLHFMGPPSNSLKIEPHTFRKIRRLELEMYDYGDIEGSPFDRCVPPSAKEVKMIIKGRTGPQLVKDLSFRGSGLDTVTLHFAHGCRYGMDDLQPLLNLSQLTRLHLTFEIYPNLHDADITIIAAALPKLIDLSLLFYSTAADDFSYLGWLTINALLPIAKHCRQLKTLAISPKISSPLPQSNPITDYRFTNLEKINFGPSNLPDHHKWPVWPVALFLSTICPGNVKFSCEAPWSCSNQDNLDVGFWSAVNDAFEQVSLHDTALVESVLAGTRQKCLGSVV